jgi:hypothetical protein
LGSILFHHDSLLISEHEAEDNRLAGVGKTIEDLEGVTVFLKGVPQDGKDSEEKRMLLKVLVQRSGQRGDHVVELLDEVAI